MKRSILGVLVYVLLALLAGGCGPTSTSIPNTATPKPDAYVGEWTGTTDQGYEIRLVVAMDGGQQYIVEVGYRIDSPGWNATPRGSEAWTMKNPAALFEKQIPVSADGCFLNNPEWMLELSGCFSGNTVTGKLAGRPEAVGWVRAGDEIVLGGDFIGETGFTATLQDSVSSIQPDFSNTTPINDLDAIYTSAAATVNAELTAAAPASEPISTNTSSPTQNPACDVKDGSWSAMTNGNTISIIFTVTDCRITTVMFMGTINGQWLVFSDGELAEPINGSQFDFQHGITDQERYRLSGTFTSPMTADIQMVIYKGFRITADQPSPFTEDMIINGTATP